MADIKLDIGGGVAPVSGTVELNIDWSALGSAFANAGSEDQADFLDAVQTGFGDYASIASELMQMTHIADAVRAEARFALRKWLIRMATALDSPGESAPRQGTVSFVSHEPNQGGPGGRCLCGLPKEGPWHEVHPHG